MKTTRRDLLKGVLGLLGLGVGKVIADKLPSAPAEPLTKPDLTVEIPPSNYDPGKYYATGIAMSDIHFSADKKDAEYMARRAAEKTARDLFTSS